MSDTVLAGRHVVVVGASRGIGRACALDLSDMGAELTIVARTITELEHTSQMIKSRGGHAYVSVADVTNPEQVRTAVEQAHARAPLWGCVNSAGSNRTGPTVGYAVEDFDSLMATNVRSTFLVCQAVGECMISGKQGGRIVNISSQMGVVGYPGRAVYCAAKHAVNGLTKALAVEWAPENITVNAVAPTFVDTALTHTALSDPVFRAEVDRRIPIGRIGTIDEVVAAVSFLLSTRASLVTGHILAVDGGWTAW